MNINYVKAENISDDKSIKNIITIIDEINKQVTDLPSSVVRQLNLYGSKRIQSATQDFILDYELKDKKYPGYEVSLFSITGIAVGQTWEFFYTSINEDDTFVEKVEDFKPFIKDILRLEIIDDLLEEISELEQDNKQFPGGKSGAYKKNHSTSQASLIPSKQFDRPRFRPVANESNYLRPVAALARNRKTPMPKRYFGTFRSHNLPGSVQVHSADGKVLGIIGKPQKKSRIKKSYRKKRPGNSQMNMTNKNTKR